MAILLIFLPPPFSFCCWGWEGTERHPHKRRFVSDCWALPVRPTAPGRVQPHGYSSLLSQVGGLPILQARLNPCHHLFPPAMVHLPLKDLELEGMWSLLISPHCPSPLSLPWALGTSQGSAAELTASLRQRCRSSFFTATHQGQACSDPDVQHRVPQRGSHLVPRAPVKLPCGRGHYTSRALCGLQGH